LFPYVQKKKECEKKRVLAVGKKAKAIHASFVLGKI
jgi:hypothetical protein